MLAIPGLYRYLNVLARAQSGSVRHVLFGFCVFRAVNIAI
jgi:hypothetical protein